MNTTFNIPSPAFHVGNTATTLDGRVYCPLSTRPIQGPCKSTQEKVKVRSNIDTNEYVALLNQWQSNIDHAVKPIEQKEYRRDLDAELLQFEKRGYPFAYIRPMENSLRAGQASTGETTMAEKRYTPLTIIPDDFVVKYWIEIKSDLDHAKMSKARDAKASKQRVLAAAASALRKGSRGKVKLVPAKYISSKRSMTAA